MVRFEAYACIHGLPIQRIALKGAKSLLEEECSITEPTSKHACVVFVHFKAGLSGEISSALCSYRTHISLVTTSLVDASMGCHKFIIQCNG